MTTHNTPKKGYAVIQGKHPVTGEMGYIPVYSKSKHAVYVSMYEYDWYPTRQEAIDATHRYEDLSS